MTVTNEFVYTHGVGDTMLERIAARQIAERTVQVRHRDLSEVVNPQPEATKVIRKLLSWIEAVDLASQRGGARPEFKATDGEPIFQGMTTNGGSRTCSKGKSHRKSSYQTRTAPPLIVTIRRARLTMKTRRVQTTAVIPKILHLATAKSGHSGRRPMSVQAYPDRCRIRSIGFPFFG